MEMVLGDVNEGMVFFKDPVISGGVSIWVRCFIVWAVEL